MLACSGYAATTTTSPLAPFSFQRRELTPNDVEIEILFCGVCHSDLHMARNEWGATVYPVVPGHEIVGRVTRAGDAVGAWRPGDTVGVGVMVDSCRACPNCRTGNEQYCTETFVGTYNDPDRRHGGARTFGGYSDRIVVDQHFVLRLPPNLAPAGVAPLLCAGITTWSPLRHWKVGPGQKVGVVGLGGLGHMGVKFAHALGARVVLFTTSPGKAEDARRLGADEVVVSKDEAQMAAHAASFDFILDCVSAPHPVENYLALLKLDGTMCLVGLPETPMSLPAFPLVLPRRQLAGSAIGGIPETQEMLDFCGEHGIVADVEVIPMNAINDAYERMLRSDVKYRFSIDMSTLKTAA